MQNSMMRLEDQLNNSLNSKEAQALQVRLDRRQQKFDTAMAEKAAVLVKLQAERELMNIAIQARDAVVKSQQMGLDRMHGELQQLQELQQVAVGSNSGCNAGQTKVPIGEQTAAATKRARSMLADTVILQAYRPSTLAALELADSK